MKMKRKEKLKDFSNLLMEDVLCCVGCRDFFFSLVTDYTVSETLSGG